MEDLAESSVGQMAGGRGAQRGSISIGQASADAETSAVRSLTDNHANVDSHYAGAIPVRPRDGQVLIGTAQTETPIGKHLIEVEVKTNKQGVAAEIGGGHNMGNFLQALQDNNGQVIGMPREVAPGIDQFEYRMPGTKRGESKVKTVYDPSKYSDMEMASLANESVGRAIYQWGRNNNKTPDLLFVSINGLKFEVPINSYKGRTYVPTAYPSGR